MRLIVLTLSLLGAPPIGKPAPKTCSLAGKVSFSTPDQRTRVSDLVVYVANKPKSVKLSPQRRFEIAQIGREFVPRTLIIQRADSVAFPNRDNIQHSVFTTDHSTVTIPASVKAEPAPATFVNEGSFDIRCDRHSNMRAWVMVVPVRELATQVGDDGTWRIDGVPAGRTSLKVVEPNGAEVELTVSACASDTVIDTALEGKLAPPSRHFNGSPHSEYQQVY